MNRPRDTIAVATVLATLITAVPALAYSTTVRRDSNVHSQPSKSAPVVGTLSAGEAVEVIRCRIFWCQIAHSSPDAWVQSGRLVARQGSSASQDDSDRDGGGGGGGSGGGGAAGNAGGIGTAGSGSMIWNLLSGLFAR